MVTLPSDFEVILGVLTKHQVRFVVVGGVAVVLQGSPRFTADLDLVVSLEPQNAKRAMEALASLGYRPRAPVPAEQFADPTIRESWVKDKGMTVFTLWSKELPATEVDLFVQEPMPFEDLFARADKARLGEVDVAVASAEDLIAMKSAVGRAKDDEDVAALKQLLAGRKNQG
jgi:predicted nucleotidyltransferase